MNKRVLSLILAVCCVLTLLSAAAPGVSAAQIQSQVHEVNIPTQVNPLYADVLNAEDFPAQTTGAAAYAAETASTDAADYVDMDTAVLQVRAAMVNREEAFTVNYYADGLLDGDSVKATLTTVLAKAMTHTGVATEGDYLLWQWGTYSAPGLFQYDTTNNCTKITYNLVVTYYTTAAQETVMDSAVDSLLAGLELEGATEYDRVKGIYDYICDNVAYDNENLDNDAYMLKYTGYAALVNRTAVCQGYAVLFYRLALELGLDARVITGVQTSSGGNHAWNIVRIGDYYYNLDATWDAGYTDYDYFLTSDANFADHTRGSSYTTDVFHRAYPMSSTDYASGTCGENAYWVLENGTLTIFGEGEATEIAWSDHKDSITAVVVEEGITSIPVGAFSGYTALISASLPTTMTEIPIGSFYNTGLTELVVPEGVTSIGMSAFGDCANLTALTLPGTLTEIGNAAFQNCAKLTDLVLPEGLTTLATGAFWGCTSLTELVLPESLTTIWGDVFRNCTGLTSVTIPAGVETMYWSVFNSCTNLTEITFLGDAPNNTQTDEDGTVTTYPVLANLTATAYYPADNATWTEEIMTSYGGTITWVAVIPTSGTCGDSAYWSFDETTGTLTIFGEGEMTEFVGSPEEYPWYTFKDQITAVVVESGVTNVGAYAFFDYPNLQRADLGAVTVGSSAFDGCAALTEVLLPDDLETIGGRAFAETGITGIELPEGLSAIGGEAFMGSKLTGVTIPGTVTEWGYDVFTDCTDLVYAELGEGQTAVYSYMFVDCTALTRVSIPSTVTYIGESAFKGCSALNNVVIPDGVTFLYTEAFGDCVSLSSVEIPASVEGMLKPFRGCTGLTELTFLGDAPVILDDKAFEGVTATAYYPGDNDTWTEEIMTSYGGTITWVAVIPTSGTCGDSAYWSFDETTGTLTIFGEGAMDDYMVREPAPWFDYRESIACVVIESGITTIGSCAFNSYPALRDVQIPDTVQAIGRGVFTLCTSLTDIELPEGITIIKDCTFADCTSLTSITLPSTLETIEMFAFNNCTALTSVTIPDSVIEIGRGAFTLCTSLTSVQLGTGLTVISGNMFNSCTALTSVEIPANIKEISCDAFAFCTGLTEITFQGDAPAIYDGAFYDVTATAYYPGDNDTWTEDVMQQYGGTITWMPYTAGHTVSFTDVTDPDLFYYEPVAWAVANGITTGTTETTFSPGDNCLRAQIVTFLWRAEGCPEPAAANNPFEDVKETDFFYKAVLWAVEQGITNGMDETHFDPTGECTRGQAVTFLWRAAGKPAASVASSFTDVDSGAYYCEAVNWAVEQGITNGMGDNMFQPNAICNRAQIVTFLYRTYHD